jgi:hypothetical protein
MVSFEIAWTWDIQNPKILIMVDCVELGHFWIDEKKTLSDETKRIKPPVLQQVQGDQSVSVHLVITINK